MVEYDLGLVVGSDGAKGDKGDKGDKGETGNGISSITLHSTSGKVKTYRVTYTNGATFDFQVSDGSDASVTVDSSLSSTSTNPVQNKVIKGALDGKSDTGHTHTKSNITDFAHTHDDRYYTETETDTLLSGKASSSHSHSKSDITDFPSIPSASSTTPSADTTNGSVGTGSTYARSNHTHPKSSLYAEASHTHSIANVTDLQSSLDGKANTSHNHTISNVTNLQTTLDGKASSSHSHTKSDITDFPTIPSKISDLTNDSDFIEKTATVGLVKNDGTIDTTAYLSQMKVGSSANYLIYTTSNGVLASKQKLGNINYLGRIGSTSGLPLKTGTNGVIETGSFGTSSGTFAEGNHTHSEYVNPVIVDNLTTDDATKVLSARQGKVLNDLIGTAIQYINQ